MKLVKQFLTENPCYKANKTIKIKGLMLHSVGTPQPSAKVFIRQWNRADYNRACVHAFIDANDGTIYQTLPWNHRGWHGGGSSNNTHIGVEMCEPSQIKYIGGSSFTCSDLPPAIIAAKKTYDSAVELFAILCKEYSLNPLTSICSHKEGHVKGISSNHDDPEHLWKGLGVNYTMDGFRQDVNKAIANDFDTSNTFSETADNSNKESEDNNMDVKRFTELYNEMRKDLQDNDASEYSKDARDWAVKNGIVIGSQKEGQELNAMWQDVVNREQIVTMLYRFAKMTEK